MRLGSEIGSKVDKLSVFQLDSNIIEQFLELLDA